MSTQPAQEAAPTVSFLILDTVWRLLIAVVAGSAAVFLITLVGGLAGKEQIGQVETVNSDLDLVMRGLIGISSATIAAALLVIGYVWTARMVALSTVLVRGREQPDARQVYPDPRGRLTENPALGARIATISLLAFTALAVIFFLTEVLSGDGQGEAIYPIGAVAGVVMIGACIAFLYGLRRLTSWWRSTRLPPLKGFLGKRNRRRVQRIGRLQRVEMILIAGGFVLFIAGLLLRQPGRYASIHHYSAQVEALIRVLSLSGAILLGLGMLVVIIRSAARLIKELRSVFGDRPVGELNDDGPFDRFFAYAMGLVTIALETLLSLAVAARSGDPILQRWRQSSLSWWTPTVIVLVIVVIGTIAAGWSGSWLRNRLRRRAG